MSLPRQSPAPLSYSSGLFRDRLRAFAKRVNTIVTQGQGGRGGCHLLGRLDCLYACVSVCTCVLVCVWKWFLCEEVRACEGVCVCGVRALFGPVMRLTLCQYTEVWKDGPN